MNGSDMLDKLGIFQIVGRAGLLVETRKRQSFSQAVIQSYSQAVIQSYSQAVM